MVHSLIRRTAAWLALLLISLATGVFAQPPQRAPAQLEAEKNLKQIAPNVRITWSSQSNTPRSVKGLLSNRITLNPEEIGSFFGRNLAGLYRIKDPAAEISPGKLTTDRRGFHHLSLYQKHRDVPVYGSSLKITLNPQQIMTGVSGKWISDIDVDAVPTLSESQSITRLTTYLRREYRGTKPLPSIITLKPDRIKLVVFNPTIYGDKSSRNYLAYHIILKTRVFFVNAHTGEVIYTYSNIQDARNRATYESDDCFTLPGTLVMNEAGPVGGATPDAEITNAHNFGGTVWDYYSTTHGRDSYDGAGATIVQTVHSGVPIDPISMIICCLLGLDCCGCLQANAAWIPSLNQMVYGDGGTLSDGRTVAPLCNANDVVAHELTHAVTQYSVFDGSGNPVGLDYTGESGALNESFSDFFGAMVDRTDWQMAEDLFTGGDALRDLSNPPAHGQPDHMDNFVAGGDVHENSGIPNKVAYLMAEGGTHPHSNITVVGIGKGPAEQILYRTLTQHLGQTATFLEAREGALLSCEELYPGDAAKYASVWNAFVACGICDPADPASCVPYSPLLGRDPVDIVIVVDFSGSMTGLAEPGGRPKIDVLKDAVEIFLRTWEIFGASGDRADIVFFDSDVNPLTVNLQPFLGNVDALVTEVRARNAAGYTAMGGAIKVALDGLSTGVSHPAVILFTNGIQNVNPMAVKVGSGSSAHYEIINSSGAWGGISSVPPAPGISLESYGTPVHIIGIGEAAANSYHELLNDITNETGALLHLTTTPDTDLRRFYLEDLVQELSLQSLTMVAHVGGRLLPRGTFSHQFTLDGGANRAAFVVHWYGPIGDKFPSFKVFGPNNARLEPTRWSTGRIHRSAVFDFPYMVQGSVLNPNGVWRVESELNNTTSTVEYQVTVLADEERVHDRYFLSRKVYATGEPLQVSAGLDVDGSYLANLEIASVTVLRPRTGLGTLLSVNSADTSGPATDLLSTPVDRKLSRLLGSASMRQQLAPVVTPVSLRDDGAAGSGDARASDGLYSTRITETQIPGLYAFRFHLKGTSASGMTVERTRTLSALVRVIVPDPRTSARESRVVTKHPDGRIDYDVSVNVTDRYSNRLGPGYQHSVSITSPNATLHGNVRDNLDGSYTQSITVPEASVDPLVRVRVFDTELYDGPLSGYLAVRTWAASAHAGLALPHGTFANAFDPGFSAAVDAERLLFSDFYANLTAAYYGFKGTETGTTYWIGLSADLKKYFVLSPFEASAYAGAGIYVPETGQTVAGLNAGVGLYYVIKRDMFLGIDERFSFLFSSPDMTMFSTTWLSVIVGW